MTPQEYEKVHFSQRELHELKLCERASSCMCGPLYVSYVELSLDRKLTEYERKWLLGYR